LANNILLTGASGFVGTNILLELSNLNFTIYALGNKNKIKINSKKIIPLYAPLHKINIVKDNLPRKIKYVIHTAAITKAQNIEDFYLVNSLGTKYLCNFLIKNNFEVEHFIHISSLAAVGPQKNLQPSTESTNPHPIKGYGESKLLSEFEVVKLTSKINWTILRPPFIFGPYDYDTLGLFRKIKYGIKIYLGMKHFSFIYSEDIAKAITKILGNEIAFEKIYFITYPKYTNQIEFENTIARYVNPRAVFIRLAPTILINLSILLKPFLSSDTAINRMKFKEIKQSFWICSAEKIKKELSIECKTSLNDAVEKSYKWYKFQKLI
jgi:nucleoside-diphosphate-sugar epimerase